MNSKAVYYFWASLLILCLAIYGLVLRGIALGGVSLGSGLLFRGLSCLLLVLLFAKFRGFALWPRLPGAQLVRALVAGLALTLITKSYESLSAASVSVLGNVDVPLILVLGSLVGQPVRRRDQVIAAGALAILFAYVLTLEGGRQIFEGVFYLFMGSVLLCFGYHFIQKSMKEENPAITILTPSISIAVFGFIQLFLRDEGLSQLGSQGALTFMNLTLLILSGLMMFLTYLVTMKLYELVSIAEAEIPSLLTVILVQPLEFYLFNEVPQAMTIVITLGFLALLYFLVVGTSRTQNDLSTEA